MVAPEGVAVSYARGTHVSVVYAEPSVTQAELDLAIDPWRVEERHPSSASKTIPGMFPVVFRGYKEK
jgi:hypothetical protein